LEHPREISWGYQVNGYFAPNSRLGSVEDFKYMINHLHENNIGVILDWVPAHFDFHEYGLKKFDGSHLFEPHRFNLKYLMSFRNLFLKFSCKHFDFTKKDIREFLISSAHFWLKEMHIDGLRIDCVSSLMKSEDPQDSTLFLKDLNAVVHKECKGAITIAEDFSGDSKILQASNIDGLGFDLQWNIPWNYFTRKYFNLHPSSRQAQYSQLKKALDQINSDNKVSFLSHDETNSNTPNLLKKLKSNSAEWEKKDWKSLISFLMTSKGKKLLFSGVEFANPTYWNKFIGTNNGIMNDNSELTSFQKEIQALSSYLNKLYTQEEALYADTSPTTNWIEDPSNTIHAYRKTSKNSSVAIFHNFTDISVSNFKVSIPKKPGIIQSPIEIFSSNDQDFIEDNRKKVAFSTEVTTDTITYTIDLPPQTTLIIKEN
ncbi:MAG: alpha-amylase family glycosyl hydrolase, partial [Chlamydiota bacterium]